MSLVPYIVNELLSELDRPSYDHHFHHPYERLMSSPSLRIGYLRPWRLMRNEDSGVSSVTNDKDGFKVNLDVQQFKPEELNVKVVDDYLCIEGKHEERSDEHGFVSRQFSRRYKLPDNVDKQALASTLSSDGVLQLTAPRLAIAGDKERAIPITQTNKPALKANKSGDKKQKQENGTNKMES